MKHLKILVPAISLSARLFLGACNSKTTSAPASELYSQGLALVSEMNEAVQSEAWVSLFTGDTAVREILSNAGQGDFSQPKAVYEIQFSDQAFTSLIGQTDLSGFSESLQKRIHAAIQSATANQINAMDGAETLAAASICTVSDTFVCDGLTENTLYLYTYENAAPVMVSFVVGQDGAVLVTGVPILCDSFSPDSPENVQLFLEGFGAQVSEITIPD